MWASFRFINEQNRPALWRLDTGRGREIAKSDRVPELQPHYPPAINEYLSTLFRGEISTPQLLGLTYGFFRIRTFDVRWWNRAKPPLNLYFHSKFHFSLEKLPIVKDNAHT